MDITDKLLEFRNIVRFLWNQHFRLHEDEPYGWDKHEAFEPVYEALFDALVLWRLPSGATPIPQCLSGSREKFGVKAKLYT